MKSILSNTPLSIKRFCIVLSIVSAISCITCSRFFYKSAYNNVDVLILNRIDYYIDLRSDQEGLLRDSIKFYHNWHRKNELPRYIATLNEIKAKANNWTREDVHWLFRSLDDHRDRLIERQIPHTARFLTTLSNEQIDHLKKRLKESNEKLIEKLRMPREERLQKRYEKTVENLEDIFGTLTPVQKKRIISLNSTLPDVMPERLRYRERIHQKFIEFMRSKPPVDQIESQLREWLLEQRHRLAPEYARILTQWQSAAVKMMIELNNIMTPENRQYAIRKISSWVQDLRELSAIE
jgi:hypothetical protein